MSYTEEIIRDSYTRFKHKDWMSIASSRIDASYKKRKEEPIGKITYYDFTAYATKFTLRFLLASLILILLFMFY